MQAQQILNSKGQPILLNAREKNLANLLQRQCNSLGYEINITSLTTILKKISEQKFFEIKPSDYVPVVAGEGAWSSNLVTYRSFQLGDDFTNGIINTGANNSRLAQADAGVDSLSIAVKNWAKGIAWSLFDLQLAAKSGNWDLISAKEESRKRNWDLGIQKVAFLGIPGDSSCLGLYTQSGVNTNTTILVQAISALGVSDLKAFCASILDTYRSNANRTAWPTHFIIPESDYLGLAAPASAQFPIKSVLEQLEDTFKIMTKNPGFKILPNAYGDAAYHSDISSIVGKQMYILLNYDEKSVRMNVPVPYMNTLANSIDNFNFQNVGLGQFTGVLALRPAEMLYLQF